MTVNQMVGLGAAWLLIARWVMELWLGWLNQRQVRAHSGAVPAAFRDFITPENYAKTVDYAQARIGFGRWADTWNLGLMLALLFSGVLPWAFNQYVGWRGDSTWALAAFLMGIGVALQGTGLPWDWWEQFHLEERFGFNNTTPGLWWLDRLKGLILTLALGYPLLVAILKIVRWAGMSWWLWAWVVVFAFQLLMMVLAPVVILPLFNKFTPLSEGSLRDRLLALAARTGFRAHSIQVMDGSKRSRHSNAFFTGFGRFRKIVLFDTLVQQLSETELEAVLAHEIGHYRLKHIPQMLGMSVLSMLAGFWAAAWLAQQAWFYRAFGFLPGTIEPALLLFVLLGGTVSFWFSPLLHAWSRRFEYQADAYAARVLGEAQALISALRKLNEKNLSNLTPHPLYSGFYYSHPTLLEREKALRQEFPVQN